MLNSGKTVADMTTVAIETGMENIAIFSKISKISKISDIFDIFDIFDIYPIFLIYI